MSGKGLEDDLFTQVNLILAEDLKVKGLWPKFSFNVGAAKGTKCKDYTTDCAFIQVVTEPERHRQAVGVVEEKRPRGDREAALPEMTAYCMDMLYMLPNGSRSCSLIESAPYAVPGQLRH